MLLAGCQPRRVASQLAQAKGKADALPARHAEVTLALEFRCGS